MKVVFVDWHKTLSTSQFWQHSEDSRLKPEQLQAVDRYVFSSPSLSRLWMMGQLSAESVCHVAAKHLNGSSDDILHDLISSCQRMELCDPTVVEVIQALRERGVKTVIATDNMDTFTRWTVPALRLDEVFDEVLNSADVRMMKKYPRFFRDWLESHGVEPSEAILLDDSVSTHRHLPDGMNFWPVVNPSLLRHVLGEVSKLVDG